jgi:hypothetical protein
MQAKRVSIQSTATSSLDELQYVVALVATYRPLEWYNSQESRPESIGERRVQGLLTAKAEYSH